MAALERHRLTASRRSARLPVLLGGVATTGVMDRGARVSTAVIARGLMARNDLYRVRVGLLQQRGGGVLRTGGRCCREQEKEANEQGRNGTNGVLRHGVALPRYTLLWVFRRRRLPIRMRFTNRLHVPYQLSVHG
jgi:hypothetical protein